LANYKIKIVQNRQKTRFDKIIKRRKLTRFDKIIKRRKLIYIYVKHCYH